MPSPAFWSRSPPIRGPYLCIVILLPHLFVSQKLVDGNGLPPCRKEERAGRLGVRVGTMVQGWADSRPGDGSLVRLSCQPGAMAGGPTRLQGPTLGQITSGDPAGSVKGQGGRPPPQPAPPSLAGVGEPATGCEAGSLGQVSSAVSPRPPGRLPASRPGRLPPVVLTALFHVVQLPSSAIN